MTYKKMRALLIRSLQDIEAVFFPLKARGLYFAFLVLPLIDSLNGCLNNGGNEGVLSVGALYRSVIILYSVFAILRDGVPKRTLVVLASCVCLIILPHVCDLINVEFLSLTVKTVLPILCIEVLIKKWSVGEINEAWVEKLLSGWSALFPLVIIVPLVLGLGFQTYGSGGAGYKGYFYAQNDLCFALSVLFFFSFGRVVRNITLSNVIKLLSLGLCIVLLGMKSGYFMLVISILYWLVQGDASSKTKSVIFSVTVLLGALFLWLVFSSPNSILERWKYFSNASDSFLSFFSSGRIERIPQAALSLSGSDIGSTWILFGSGTLYGSFIAPYGLVEMDPFDLFFQYGLVGLAFFAFYYGRFLICRLPRDRRFYRLALIMALTMSLLAGHVLNSALSSMVFAVLCGAAWIAGAADDVVVKNV